MVLVTVNLVIFTAIVAVIYLLFRRAWGRLAAFTSTAIFISIFGFAQYVGIPNFNYATPYAHESTHGLLICLLLLFALFKWTEQPTVLRSVFVGLLFGLTIVEKSEFVLAGAVLLGVAFLPRLRSQAKACATVFLTALVPFACFTIFFSLHVSFPEALHYAGWGIWNALSSRYTADPIQKTFLGLDQPASNLLSHAIATAAGLAVIAVIAGVAKGMEKVEGFGLRVVLLIALAGGILAAGVFGIEWMESGKSFLGLTLVYVGVCWFVPKSGTTPQISALRISIALLAAVLMLRMVLNGRLYQYGFYQAALGGILIPAVMIGELPDRLQLGRWGKCIAAGAAVLLLTTGVVALANRSAGVLDSRMFAIGEAGDQFYSYPPESDPRGAIVQGLVQKLKELSGGRSQTLLVLPEGVMINYLARMPEPIAPVFFYSSTTANGRERGIVEDLLQHPPDRVVLISRDLREYGIERYGQTPGHGQQILAWLNANYAPELKVGADPLDPDQFGGVLYKPNAR